MKKVKIEIEISNDGNSSVKTNGINTIDDVKFIKASIKVLNSISSGMILKFKKEQEMISLAEKNEEKRLVSLKESLSSIFNDN